jgi:hypothetical protein
MTRTILLATVAWLTAAAPAAAQEAATATPNTVGKGSRVHFEIDATLPPVGGRIPSGLTVAGPPGLTWNPGAVAKRCTRSQASLNECSPQSRIGTASLVIAVQTPTAGWDATIDLTLYLRPTRGVLAVGFVLGGTRVVPGLIDASNGVILSFNPLPTPPPFEGVTFSLKHVTVDIGASRRVERNKRKVRVHLLRNPKACIAGAWPSAAMLAFPDGTNVPLAAPMTCSPA